jgi:hypothetical protein
MKYVTLHSLIATRMMNDSASNQISIAVLMGMTMRRPAGQSALASHVLFAAAMNLPERSGRRASSGSP